MNQNLLKTERIKKKIKNSIKGLLGQLKNPVTRDEDECETEFNPYIQSQFIKEIPWDHKIINKEKEEDLRIRLKPKVRTILEGVLNCKNPRYTLDQKHEVLKIQIDSTDELKTTQSPSPTKNLEIIKNLFEHEIQKIDNKLKYVVNSVGQKIELLAINCKYHESKER